MDSSESSTPGGSQRGLHRGFLTAGAVVAMVLAGLGVAGAQTGDSTTPTTEAPQASQSGQAEDAVRPADCGPGHRGKANLAVAASTIGVTEEELLTALRGGQSIAQVAQSKDVDVQKVIDALVADAKAKLAQAVEDGRLTQAQADEKAANLAERITATVNREGLPARGPGGHRRHGPPPDVAPTPEAEPSSVTVDT